MRVVKIWKFLIVVTKHREYLMFSICTVHRVGVSLGQSSSRHPHSLPDRLHSCHRRRHSLPGRRTVHSRIHHRLHVHHHTLCLRHSRRRPRDHRHNLHVRRHSRRLHVLRCSHHLHSHRLRGHPRILHHSHRGLLCHLHVRPREAWPR